MPAPPPASDISHSFGRKTRAAKARELKGLLERGPSFGLQFSGSERGRDPEVVAQEAVKRWLDSWVTPLVEELVPELKKK